MDLRLLFPAPDTAGAYLLAQAVKGALILGAAGAIVFAMRRGSASMRHLVWLLAIAGVLAAPLLSLVAPPLRLSKAYAPSSQATAGSPAAMALDPIFAPPQASAMKTPASGPLPTSGAISNAAPGVVPGKSTPAVPVITPRWPAADAAMNLRLRLIMAVWAIVALAALIRLAAGFALAGRAASRCPLVTNPVLLAEMETLSQEAGVGRRGVELRQSTIAIPMTTGLLRPIVLLPMGAEAWPVDLRTAALRHELAHIARRDWAWHALAGVVCALHWFNPMAWVAARQIREESERACDDAVLAAGTRPTDYAEHLLAIAKQLSPPEASRPGAAIAMAQRPFVEARMRAILHTGLDRSALNRRRTLASLLAAVLLLAPVAALRTAAQDQFEARAQRGKLPDQGLLESQMRRRKPVITAVQAQEKALQELLMMRRMLSSDARPHPSEGWTPREVKQVWIAQRNSRIAPPVNGVTDAPHGAPQEAPSPPVLAWRCFFTNAYGDGAWITIDCATGKYDANGLGVPFNAPSPKILTTPAKVVIGRYIAAQTLPAYKHLSATSRSPKYKITLAEIYAPISQLTKMGFDASLPSLHDAQGSDEAAAAKLIEAARAGKLRLQKGQTAVVPVGGVWSYTQIRDVLCTDSVYWAPDPVPQKIKMKISITPFFDTIAPGGPMFQCDENVTPLGKGDKPQISGFGPVTSSSSGHENVWRILLATPEEQYSYVTRTPGEIKTEGVMHLLLGKAEKVN
ncbi:MAG: M56 family metallopeptidase [Capsulimonas sp.]|uniref:M56 family metallopeptidase n=1 Tax=Capsulimonas sp. TaxID=2494211 RepID=UPI003265DD74